MFSLLDSMIENHGQNNSATVIVSEDHDASKSKGSCAALDASTGRVALMSARILPWHGLGVVVNQAATSAEAIRLASLDWKVSKIPMSYEWNGIKRESEDTYAIVRGDTGKQLASVGGRLELIECEAQKAREEAEKQAKESARAAARELLADELAALQARIKAAEDKAAYWQATAEAEEEEAEVE
jgi:hypothetical protein